MNQPIKTRIWDNVEGCWFKTIYDRFTGVTREMFLSQNGELYLHEKDTEGKITLTPQTDYEGEKSRYIASVYTGIRDRAGARLYFGDIVRNPSDQLALIVWEGASIALKWQADPEFSHAISESALRNLYERIGDIYEHPHLFETPKTT